MELRDDELSEISGGTKIPYIVQKGDTLGALAQKFHCTVEDLCKWNKIQDPNQIDVDQKLIILF